LVLWFAFNRRIPLQRWGRFGDFSYGLCVFGWPVQQTIIHFAGNQITPGMLFMTAFPAALCLAMASWYLVERPFLRLKSRGRQNPAADALTPAKTAW
jgi:peptidoglycan/LPS O-acetylase OafA/YrhL